MRTLQAFSLPGGVRRALTSFRYQRNRAWKSSSSLPSGGDRMALNYRSPIVVEPREPATAAVIFMHGLGDQGDGWASMIGSLPTPWVRYIFPNAPNRPITVNGGMLMPGWFDLSSLDMDSYREDISGVEESIRYVETLIDDQISKGVPAERILVGGFSQGGALSLSTVLASEKKFAGCLCLSGFRAMSKGFPEFTNEANRSIPILMCHGDIDQVVQERYAQSTFKMLEESGTMLICTTPPKQKEFQEIACGRFGAGANISYKLFPNMGHELSQEAFLQVSQYLVETLPRER